MSGETVTVIFEDGIAIVTINNPPVNATSSSVRIGLSSAVTSIASSNAKAAIIRCEGRTFVAGGDISEFDKPTIEPHLPDVCDAIEASPVPFIAAMHGTVLGGGFEIALSCAWRIALADTKFGLPEVNIGLIPGAGGTQRLPRLVGVENAMDIACSGAMFSAAKLLSIGGIDAIVENLDAAVLDFINDNGDRPTGVSTRSVSSLSQDWYSSKRAELVQKSKGQQSPIHAFEAIKWSGDTEYTEGLRRERERFIVLKKSSESIALRHAFFAERKAGKPEAIKDGLPKSLKKIAIVGGGLMGAGIAASCLSAGYKVQMIERDESSALAGLERVNQILLGSIKRGKLSEEDKYQQLAKFTSGSDYFLAADCDLAVEAVFEDLDVKRAVFEQLAKVMRADAILATNTSYIDPDRIFEKIPHLDRCLGLHFFSPAHIMRLVEIVRTNETSFDTLATGFAFAKQLKKISALSGVCDGFIGNRMLAAYRRQADYMLADGALPYQIDEAMRAFGMPMGPYELQDLTGLQIAWATRKRQAEFRNPNERYISIGDQLCEMERLGQRVGKGWYRYEEGSRVPIRDLEVETLIEAYSTKNDIKRRPFDIETIQNRLVTVLANEGALIVEEGIAQSFDDVDVVKLHGYGFPRWRGGPMHYVSHQGKNLSSGHMKEIAHQSPNSWKLSQWLGT